MPAVASIVAALALTAPWLNGGSIPKRYTCDGKDVRPAIGWWESFRPNATRPRRWYAIEMVDLDAPGGRFVHWLELARVQGRNDFGKLGYGGPCPPPGDAPHRYVVRVYALSRRPALRSGFTESQLHAAIRGSVVETGSIVGRYGR